MMSRAGASSAKECLTFAYKEADCGLIYLDVYPPSLESPTRGITPPSVPAVVFFHGGGLTVGERRSWFPNWLKERITASGMTFISTDHRLLPPSTGHDIIEDIEDLFRFLERDLNALLRSNIREEKLIGMHPFQVDTTTLAVSGVSAGGLCAYLAVITHLLFADLCTEIPHYFSPKSGVFFRGREILEPANFSEFLYPHCVKLEQVSGSPLAYHGPEHPIPGFPANARMLLPRLYLQLGIWLDYYTGEHAPSLSEALREAVERGSDPRACIPERHVRLWPQLHVDARWPPTFLMHGSADTAVPVQESQHMQQLLEQADVPVTLRVLEGQEHSLDKAPGADEAFGGPGGLFDEVKDFLVKQLQG